MSEKGAYLVLILLVGCSNTTGGPATDSGLPDSPDLSVPAVCGDGVRSGDEECDDGNEDHLDLCSPGCRLPGAILQTHSPGYRVSSLFTLPSGDVMVVTARSLYRIADGQLAAAEEYIRFGEGDEIVAANSMGDEIVVVRKSLETREHQVLRIDTARQVVWEVSLATELVWRDGWSVAAHEMGGVVVTGGVGGTPVTWQLNAGSGVIRAETRATRRSSSRFSSHAAMFRDGHVVVSQTAGYGGAELTAMSPGGTVLWRFRGGRSFDTVAMRFMQDGQLVVVGGFRGAGGLGVLSNGTIRWFDSEGTRTREETYQYQDTSTDFRYASIHSDGSVVAHARQDFFSRYRVLLLIRDGLVQRQIRGPQNSTAGPIVISSNGRVFGVELSGGEPLREYLW